MVCERKYYKDNRDQVSSLLLLKAYLFLAAERRQHDFSKVMQCVDKRPGLSINLDNLYTFMPVMYMCVYMEYN